MLVGGGPAPPRRRSSWTTARSTRRRRSLHAVSFNSFTDAIIFLQFMLEAPLEKKTGTMFGPPGNKEAHLLHRRLQHAHARQVRHAVGDRALRQQVDYGGFYDLKKLTHEGHQGHAVRRGDEPDRGLLLRSSTACSATSPPSRSPFPEARSLNAHLRPILAGHLAKFERALPKQAEKAVGAGAALHKRSPTKILPTPVKFHYQWNLRDLSRVFQGVLHAPARRLRGLEHDGAALDARGAPRLRRPARPTRQTSRARSRRSSALERVSKTSSDSTKASCSRSRSPLRPSREGEGRQDLLQDRRAERRTRKILSSASSPSTTRRTQKMMDLVLFDDAMEHVCASRASSTTRAATRCSSASAARASSRSRGSRPSSAAARSSRSS